VCLMEFKFEFEFHLFEGLFGCPPPPTTAL
jgi:hypothetical protein